MAGVISGLPSTANVLIRSRSVGAAIDYVQDATARIGVLLPPFRPGLARGVMAHGVVTLLVAEVLGSTVPQRRSVGWGGIAGLAIGVVTVGVIGRRVPAIAELSLGPQLADNLVFGVVFAAVVDRP